jgi:hypothetical protein
MARRSHASRLSDIVHGRACRRADLGLGQAPERIGGTARERTSRDFVSPASADNTAEKQRDAHSSLGKAAIRPAAQASKTRRIAKSLAILEESPALGSFCQNLGLGCKENTLQSNVEIKAAVNTAARLVRWGTPITLGRRRCRRPIAIHLPLRLFRRAKHIGDQDRTFKNFRQKLE